MQVCYAFAVIDGYPDIDVSLRHWIGKILPALRAARGAVVCYDVGANDGHLVLPFLDRIDHLVAFEPGPAADRFAAALPPERSSDVTLFRTALGQGAGSARLEVYSDDTFSSLHPRDDDQRERYDLDVAERINVPVAALDDTIAEQNLPVPGCIKMDIEGAELYALRGMAGTIRAARPALIVEYSCVNCANAGYDRTEILDFLRNLGYDPGGLFRAEDPRLHRGAELAPCSIWNLVCLPADLAHLDPGA